MSSDDVFSAPAHAWVRAPGDAYAACLRSDPGPIDVALARTQHRAYVEALGAAGVGVEHLAPGLDAPDGCFIEDTAVVWDGGALVTRPGAPSRRGETPSVRAVLEAAGLDVVAMEAPATLDGGDVLRVGSRLLVGESARTNAAGVAALAAHAGRFGLSVETVPLRSGLHLKSALTLLEPGVLLLGAGVEAEQLARLPVELIPVTEPYGANVLALGRRVLVSAQAPVTAERIERRGLEPVTLDVSELHRGDGALTCLSLRRPAPGAYCA